MIVAIVTPEMGLLEEPTTPAIYPATAENRNDATSISTATTIETRGRPMIWRATKYSGTIETTSARAIQ